MSKPVCEMPKNSRETIRFSLGEFKGHKFVDVRIWVMEEGKDAAPTKKGLAVSPSLWPQFRQSLDQVEAELLKDGWLDQEDLEHQAA